MVLYELLCEFVFEHCGHAVFSHVNPEWVSFDDDAFAVDVQRVLVELHGDVEFEFGDAGAVCYKRQVHGMLCEYETSVGV